MKIVRAMKKIARLKGELKVVKHRLQNCLNTLVENEFDEKFDDLSKEFLDKRNEMMKLKAGVMHANVKGNMFRIIIQLGEMKSYMDFLKELEPKTGLQESRYSMGEGKSKYKSQLTITLKNQLLKECQDKINELTDILDEFNAKTEIEDVIIQ